MGYASCVKQFWTTAKVKKVNDQEQIQAFVDKQKVIITKESIRRDLDEAKGTACLPNDTIFEELAIFLDKQVEGMAKHKEIYVMSSRTKKIFANMKRQGQGFSGNVTPLFETMMANAQEEMGEGSSLHTDSHHTPTDNQLSLSKPQKKIKPKRKQRQTAKVLNLEEAKIAQVKEIAKLKKRVKKLEKRKKSRPAELRRLKKVGSSKQVKSSREKDSLGAQEDASKQERSIEDIDQDTEIALVDEAQGRIHDANMFGFDELEDEANRDVIEEWDVVQATIDVDRQRKYFAAKRAEEIRNKPPTKAHHKSLMCTYMRNMEGFKQKDFKGKSFDDIKKLFDKIYKRVNTFVDIDTENVEESLKKTQAEGNAKRAGQEIEKESAKKQKLAEQE
nr:hypothetical protein [Tanacetum cinerariifolium]